MTDPELSRQAESRPAKLYKYRALGDSEDFTKAILLQHKIWFAQPSSFNDPFDCNLYVPFQLSSGEFGARLLDRFWPKGDDPQGKAAALSAEEAKKARALAGLRKLAEVVVKAAGVRATAGTGDDRIDLNETVNEHRHERVEKVVGELDASVGVLSLSACPDHILLWSHYAASHTGLCLELDFEKLNAWSTRLQPVRYGPMPEISPKFPAMIENLWRLAPENRTALILELAAALSGGALSKNRSKDLEEALHSEVADLLDWFYAKSELWGYEREWRVLKLHHGLTQFPAEVLTGVIVGCSAPEGTLEKVRAWANERETELSISVARRKEGEFGVEIVGSD